MNDIVFLDTETTGVHPEREIWEIAMVKRSSEGYKEITIQVVPVDLSKADPFALRINHFYDRYVGLDNLNAPSGTTIMQPWEAAETVESWTRGAHIIGAVPNFDTESFDKLLRQSKLLPAWHYHLIDVETLTVGYLKGQDAERRESGLASIVSQFNFSLSWKSEDLSRAIGVEPPTDEERHTAMGDVQWAIKTFDKVMGS